MDEQPGDKARALRIHQALARQLGTAILSGEYKPGDTFPGEIEHSAALNVSRTPYREAIRTLTAKGLLVSRPKVGTRVNPRQQWNVLDPDMLAWMFSGVPDEAFVRDLFELRSILEPAAAALAAQRRTADHLKAMRGALDLMELTGLAAVEAQEADRMFHRVILEASENLALASLSSSVGAAVRWTTHYKQRASDNPRDPLPDHLAVFDAIVAADADKAKESMQQLLQLALEDMVVS